MMRSYALSRKLVENVSKQYFKKLQFRSHGGGNAGEHANKPGLLGWYLRMNANYPLATAVVTSAGLWFTGDVFAQQMSIYFASENDAAKKETAGGHQHEATQGPSSPPGMDIRRLAGTTAEGCIVGGGVGYFWYQALDRIVTKSGLQSGTLRFVCAKMGLEMSVWHPVSLVSFWVLVGLWEGHSFDHIRAELRKDFAPTLASEIALWGPLDVFNFWKVPVHLQVIFANAGCLIEAVGLSYIHEHGFPGFVTGTNRKTFVYM
jgi:hypothetical protein